MHVFEDGEKCGYIGNRKDHFDRHERSVSAHALLRLAAILLFTSPFRASASAPQHTFKVG
jgi:hypothetical protein